MHHLANKQLKQIADSKLKADYGKYYASIYKFCLSRLKDDSSYVDDCVQEAFVVLYKRLLSGEEIEYTQAFLYKTASNLIKKRFAQLKREEKNISLEEIREIPSHSVDIDDRLSFEEYSKMFDVPSFRTLDITHKINNLTLPFGKYVELNV